MKPNFLGEVTDHGPITPRNVVPIFFHMILMRTGFVVSNELLENLTGADSMNLATLERRTKWVCNDLHERLEALLIIITVSHHCCDEDVYEEDQVRSYEDYISRLNTHHQGFLLQHRGGYWVYLVNREIGSN